MNLAILDAVAQAARDLDIGEALIGGDLERTIEGASTLTLEVHDPYRKLIRASSLQRAVDLRYEGNWWRLVQLRKAGPSVSLTFEDRDVAFLRQHSKPRKVGRDKMTRAQFVRSLVREVKKGHGIEFACPELDVRQPVGERRDEGERRHRRQAGLAHGAHLTVKGARATAEQRRNGQRVLDVADALNAGAKATKALMMAVIVESLLRNVKHGDRDSLGILQVRVSTSGSASRSLDIEWCVEQFLQHGFYTDELGGGGAIAIAKRHPQASAGRVAQATQGSGVPGAYDLVADEVDRWVAAYGGASSGGDRVREKRYEFSRGEPGKRETSWAAIQRLAEEVKWRAFTDRGTLHFASEDFLSRSKALYTITEDSDGVDWIDFDVDAGKEVSELTVTAHAASYQVRIGSVMAIEEMGLANGRYLVTAVRGSVFGDDVSITLQAPAPALPEPAAETVTTSGRSRAGAGGSSRLRGTLRERIIAVAEQSLSSKTGFNRYTWSGPLTADPTPAAPARTDCSQWVRAVYLKAGAEDPGTYTGDMIARGRRTHSPKPGDLIINAEHVELFVGGEKTYGHGSPPIDASTVAWCRGRGMYFLTYDFLDGPSADEEPTTPLSRQVISRRTGGP